MSAAQAAAYAQMQSRQPTPAQARRIIEAYLPQDVKPLEAPFQFRGWRIARYPSHITPGWIYVCADRLKADGKPEIASEDCADDAKAKAWLKGLPR